MPLKKRLRYRVKPMTFLDVNMVSRFDACIGLSPDVQKYFSPSVPFLWMPGACSDRVEPANGSIPVAEDRPVRFGYFGALAEHAGIYEFTEMFLRCSTTATLHICGYGKAGARVANLAQQSSRVEFQGFLPATDDCLAFGRSCDVLVNPRPPTHGNENNFPSKVFDYALCGRAILTSGLSGVDEVLGKNAFYFEAQRFRETLPPILTELANTPVAELHRRGGLIREKVVSEYTWSLQGSRINKFIDALI
jgi:glycosyltransferase involved in cell wall biosynthesis